MVKVVVIFLTFFTLIINTNAKTYYGEYYKVSNINNLNKDEYLIIKNKYFKRDKLVLEDNIMINDINTKIIDFIKYSSGNVMLDCNINYNINGIYYCIFKLNDIVIKKDIYINIDNFTNKEDNVIKLSSSKIIEKDIKKDNNNFLRYIKIIIFIILISIELVLMFKKKKKKFCRKSLKFKKN